MTYHDVISENIEEMKKFHAEKKGKYERLDQLKARQGELDRQKQNILKQVPRNYHTLADLEQAIKEKQTKYETSSLSNKDEKALLKDIDVLKRALPEMRKLQEIEPEMVKIKEEQKKIRGDLDIVKKLIDVKDKKIQDVRQQSEAVKAQRSEVREKADVFNKQIDEGNEKMRKAYQTKDQMRESYFKQLLEWEIYNDRVHYIKTLMNQQKKLKQAKNEKADRIEKKRQELLNRPNPYQKEIDTCGDLVTYCQKLKAQHGLVPATSEEVAKSTQQQLINDYNKQDLEQKLKEGKIQAVEKGNDEIVTVGGNKGKKGKKPKQQAKQGDASSKTFQVDFAVINKFGLVQVSPPI